MATQFPVPQQGAGEPLATFQQRARDWCRMFAEQIKFEFPNDGYGVKSSSPSNPQSKDTVARLVGGHLFIWDIFIAVDTGHPTLNLNALSQDITGQNFIPVTAHNWLSAPAPPGPPPAGAPDKLSADDRGFKHGSGRFDWKCATSFQMLQRVVASGIGSVTGDLDALAGLGVTSIRVLGMASNLFSLTPSAVNYFPSLVALADALQTRNMAMEFTVFADAQLVAPSQAGRLDHVKNVANQLLARPNVIVEIANEPWNNGITSYGDLIALANAYRAIDSRRALALGSDQNDKSLAAAVPPTNYIAFHGSRLGGREWAYRYMDGDHLPITQTARVPYDNEPINAGDGRIGQIDGNPAHWLFAAGVSRARRFQLTFHFPEGRFSKRPDQGSQNLRDCFNAWKAGLDAIPFDSGGSYVSTFHAQDARCPITGAAAGGIIRLSGRFDGTRGWAVLSGTAPLLPAIISGWTATLITSRGGGDDMTAIYFVAVTGSGGPGTPPDPPPPPIGGGSGGGNPPPRV